MRFSVVLICVMVIASGCGPSERERFEATEKLLSAWDKETNQSRAEYIRVLISEGANVNAKDKNGRTPLMLASDPEVIKVLRDAGAKGPTTAEVVQASWKLRTANYEDIKADYIRVLISEGADVNVRNSGGWTPLMFAAHYSRPEIAELLIEKGAELEARSDDGLSPLMLAAKESSTLEIVQLLVEKGAELEARGPFGKTPLMFAVRSSKPKIVKLLIEKGADVNAVDERGDTPLMWAGEFGSLTLEGSSRRYGYAKIKELLKAAGAKE